MRIERWYWLPLFCAISLAVHLGFVLKTRLALAVHVLPGPTEIEVALQAPPPEPPKPEVKPAAKPLPKPTPSSKVGAPVKRITPMPVRLAKALTVPRSEKERVPEKEPGGFKPLAEEKPLPLGLPSGTQKSAPKLQNAPHEVRIAGGGGSQSPGPIPGERGGLAAPESPPEEVLFHGGGAGGEKLPRTAPRMGGGGGRSILSVENPLA